MTGQCLTSAEKAVVTSSDWLLAADCGPMRWTPASPESPWRAPGLDAQVGPGRTRFRAGRVRAVGVAERSDDIGRNRRVRTADQRAAARLRARVSARRPG